MRIISGKYKGKNINFIKNSKTRPLKDSVKESIFNILVHSPKVKIKLENSSVLDLYSGVGSFGLECISRGARKITFVDSFGLKIDLFGDPEKLSIVTTSSFRGPCLECKVH